jgi:hypothetical protein
MRLLEIGASSRGGGGVGNCGAKNRMTQQRASQQVSRQKKNKRGFENLFLSSLSSLERQLLGLNSDDADFCAYFDGKDDYFGGGGF